MKRELVDKHKLLNQILEYNEEDEDSDIDYVMTETIIHMFDYAEVVEERKHGKWKYINKEEDGNCFYMCSVCGSGDIHAPEVTVPYCWKCGAKMDEERKEG